MSFFSSHRMRLFALLSVCLVLVLAGCSSSNSVAALRTTSDSDSTLLDTSTDTQTLAQNLAPILKASSDVKLIGFGGEVRLIADVIDPDGDRVDVSWTPSGGVIVSHALTEAVWQAPSTQGTFEIICRADDKKGGIASQTLRVDVVGGRTYNVTVEADRAAMLVMSSPNTGSDEWIALPQAEVTIPALGLVGITDLNGKAAFQLDSGNLVVNNAEVRVKYLDWDITFIGQFASGGTSISDNIRLYPGFENTSVAIGRGDSFKTKRGDIEVEVTGMTGGVEAPLTEAVVSVGSQKQTAIGGRAFVNMDAANGETAVSVAGSGYSDIKELRVPVAIDGLTIVKTRMRKQNETLLTDPLITWMRPYNGMKNVTVSSSFEIGFGQPMNAATIFDQFQMTVQIEGYTTKVISGAALKDLCDIEWPDARTLRLKPKQALLSERKYNLMISQWYAETIDGRALRNYNGMLIAFTTASDGSPRILSMSPKNGDVGVSRAGPFVIKFDRPMSPQSLLSDLLIEITDMKSGAKVTLNGVGFAEEFTATWSEDDKTLSLVPRHTLDAGRSYLVKITRAKLQSRSGLALEGASQLWCQFTTGSF